MWRQGNQENQLSSLSGSPFSIPLSLDFNFEPEKVFSCLYSQTPLELFFNFGENIPDILFVKMSIISKKCNLFCVHTFHILDPILLADHHKQDAQDHHVQDEVARRGLKGSQMTNNFQ